MTEVTGRILDGKATAAAVREDVGAAAAQLPDAGDRPHQGEVYVRNKDRDASQAGFHAQTIKLPAGTAQADLIAEVERLNADASVHGILVQLPLPGGLDQAAIVPRIAPSKDVDGLTPASVAALVTGQPGHRPCTPSGCVELMRRAGLELSGRHVVIVGRSQLVGKPMVQLALEQNATATICHSRTQDLAGHCRRADVLVAAVGVPKLVKGDWIKPGAVVLDVGINRGEDGKLVGDVDFEAARQNAGWITPVPGGIGPMTRAMLLVNTLASAARSAGTDLKALGLSG